MSELLTVSEVADILRVDDTTVRRWVKQSAHEAVILPHVSERQGYCMKWEPLDEGGVTARLHLDPPTSVKTTHQAIFIGEEPLLPFTIPHEAAFEYPSGVF